MIEILVTIITIYYNREDHVIESLNSLINQTYKNIEIIAIDDGSLDNTYKKMQTLSDPRLKIITQKNKGFVKSIQDAVNKSKGDIIAIHGSGDYSYPKRIEKQLSLLNQFPKVGIVGSYVENINKVTDQVLLHKPIISKNITKQLLNKNIYTHGEVMFRKDVYLMAGGYRELFKFSQDYDLWLRMSLITEFAVVKEILYKRYTLENGVNASFQKRILQMKLVELSRVSLISRLKNIDDPVEVYGNYAPFYMNRSKRLAKKLIRLAINALTQGDYKEALFILELSKNEKNKISSNLLLLFIKIIMKSTSAKIIFSILLKQLRNYKNRRINISKGIQ